MANYEELKQEFYLEINDFQKIDTVEGLYALARLVQTLCLLEPGSYPNHPEMGIGIANFKFEYADDETISEIKSRINDQISKYIGSSFITNVDAKMILDEKTKKQNKVAIAIDLMEGKNFILTFENSEINGKIISDIFI